MRKSDPTEAALNALADLRTAPDSAERVQKLRSFLGNRSNAVAAKAAKIAGELRIAELGPDLVAAFERFMADPAKLDKGCAATTAIAGALCALDYTEAEAFLKGIRHVQMEGSFGPPVDAAVELRGKCALGLIRTHHPDSLFEVVTLLADREAGARAAAARALGAIAGDTGALLLRFKVLVGDREADVVAECFSGLLAAGTDRAFSFVASYVDHADAAISEAAVLALGESRSAKGFEILKEKWSRTARGAMKQTLLLAFATARQECAIEFLLSLIRDENVQVAADAIAAMRIYRDDERVHRAVQDIVTQRGEAQLVEAFRAEL
jgi:hypothetical protein